MANPKKGTSQARNEFIWGWAFILPTMLGLIILNIYPIFKTIYESFFKTGDFGKGNIFIGFDNYVKLFHDAEVWQALLNTFKYAIVEVPFSIAIALVLAVLLNRKMKGRAVYRTIFFLPMVAAPAAIAMVWRWLFNSEFGLLNHIFHTKINWISDPKIAVYAIAVIGVWSIIGYNMVLFLAGLQAIPGDQYEAASIDGAGAFQKFLYVTLPGLKNVIKYVVMITMIQAMKLFTQPYVMTQGGPQNSTRTLVYYIYEQGFQSRNFGYACSVATVFFVIVVTMSLMLKRVIKAD